MTGPGVWLRNLAARLLDAKTVERFVDPTLADLQEEHRSAVGTGRPWQWRRAWCVGHCALVRIILVSAAMQLPNTFRASLAEDRRVLLRTLGAGACALGIGTLAVVAFSFLIFVPAAHAHRALLALYLIPQALPVALPVGLAMGALWMRREASPGVRSVFLMLAAVSAVASFVLLGWLVPESNQAFREAMWGAPVSKGFGELTLGELAALTRSGMREWSPAPLFDAQSLAFTYHSRWALSLAPLSLGAFTSTLVRGQRQDAGILVIVGCLLHLAYYTVLDVSSLAASRPVLSAWIPDMTFAVLTCAFLIRDVVSTRAPMSR